MLNKDYAILVLSCDKHNDLWDPFFQCFDKYWSDCPYKVYLGSNTVKYKKSKVNTIYSGEDIDWSSSTKKLIEQIDEKYIWVFLEDIVISEKIDTNYIKNIFEFCKNENVKHINEADVIKPDSFYNGFGIYPKKMPYRVNVIGFWDRKYLYNLLLDGESPWNFEIMGSYRASYSDGFYSPPKKTTAFVNIVEKGKWVPKSVNWCKKNNIDIVLDARKTMSARYHLFSILKINYFNLILNVSWLVRLKIMNIFRKLFISY